VGEIHGHRSLAAIRAEKIRRYGIGTRVRRVRERWSPAARIVTATGSFYLYDLSAQIA